MPAPRDIKAELRKNGVVLIAVALIVLMGVLLDITIRFWAVESGEKYIPLIGSCITAMTALVAVSFTGLGLWLTYWSHSNPFRLELHKRQTDVICELSRMAQDYADILFTWHDDRTFEKMKDFQNLNMNTYSAIRQKHRASSVLLPAKMNAAVLLFLDRCWGFKNATVSDYERKKDLTGRSNELRDHLAEFMNVCRDSLATEALSEQTSRFLSAPSRQNEPEGPENPPLL